MSFQRDTLPPLPSSPKLPTKPEFSGFSFSARFGAPTLLERMGHGPRSSGLLARPTPAHNTTLETSPPASLAIQESQNVMDLCAGSSTVDLSSPRNHQPTLDQEQNQSMDLDTPQVRMSPSFWRLKSPPPLNALAISDLWADAERVQNEWASVERTKTESVPNSCSSSLSQDESSALSSNALSVTASKGLSIPTELASTVHTQIIKQEDNVIKEELGIRTKTENEEMLDQRSLLFLDREVSGQELKAPAQIQRKTTPEESSQKGVHDSDSDSIETPRLSQAIGEKNPASDCAEAQPSSPQENHKQNQGGSEIDTLEIPIGSPVSRLDASRSSSQSEKSQVHRQDQPGIYSRPGYQAPIHRERGNTGKGTFSKRQHNSRSVGMKKTSIQSPMDNGFHTIPTAPRGYRSRGEDFLRASPRSRRSPSPPLRRSPPPRRFSRSRSPLRASDYPLRRGSPRRSSPSQALSRARSPDTLVGRYSPPPPQGYGRYSPPSRRFASRSWSRSPPPYRPVPRLATPPVLTISRPIAYSPRAYTQPDTYAINAEARGAGYNRSRSFGLSRYASPERPLNYPVHGTYTRSPISPVSQVFDQGGMQLPFSQGGPPHQQTTFPRSQIEGNNGNSKNRLGTAITSLDIRQESEREQARTLKRNLAEADLRNEPSTQGEMADEESVVAKRRRVGHSNEENNGISANGVSQEPQEISRFQSALMDQNSSSIPKVPLLARLAGNSSSLQELSATPNLVEGVHRPLLAQRKAGILEERSPVSKRITQDGSPDLRPEQTTNPITSSKPPASGSSSSGGVSLNDRIHGTPGRLPPLAPSITSIPSQPRRHSESGSNVSLVNRLDGVSNPSFSSHQDTTNTSQNIPLAHRITSSVSANSYGKPAPHPRRGGYGHGRGGPRNLNAHPAPAPSHVTNQANQTSLANRLR